jgi:ankyrin repeat protein
MHVLTNVASDDLNDGIGCDIANPWVSIDFCHDSVLKIVILTEGSSKLAKKEKMSDALIDAVKENDIALLKQLIEDGADVNGVDEVVRTALFWAAVKGFVGCARLLLVANADVNKGNRGGWTPLHIASSNGHGECVKVRWLRYLFGLWMKNNLSLSLLQLLIDWKAIVNAKENDGRSPLHLAAEQGQLACVEVC